MKAAMPSIVKQRHVTCVLDSPAALAQDLVTGGVASHLLPSHPLPFGPPEIPHAVVQARHVDPGAQRRRWAFGHAPGVQHAAHHEVEVVHHGITRRHVAGQVPWEEVPTRWNS